MHTLGDISEMKTNLVQSLNYEMCCEGTNHMDIYKTGQVVDMIKDLASAEKDCMEKCYYENVINAMHQHDFEDEFEVEAEGRMGYDNRRYANGQYAPKGHGHYSPVHGYTPNRMGYPMSQTGTTKHTTMNRMGHYPSDPMLDGVNSHLNDYRESKRHYTTTKDPNEKMKMDHFAKTYADETVESIKEIWHDADPEIKKELKGKLSKLLAEMQI